MKCRLTIPHLVAWTVLVSSSSAHPVSHTDAWIRVSDSVDVRLNVFLDDVLRHQSLLPETATTVPGPVVAAAIEAHGQFLLRQLRIFDREGRQLPGQITSVPKWTATQQEVDLSIDASLKLTWKISFQPVDSQTVKHLSFLHHFTHPSLDSVGELRLHLLDKTSSRRVDAVIPAERLHTIILPDQGPKSVANTVGNHSALNQLTSRLMIGPTHVNVEFECPLVLLDVAWQGSNAFTCQSPIGLQKVEQPTLSEARSKAVKKEIELWFAANTDLAINGTTATPESVVVEFVPSQFDNARLPDKQSAFEPVAVFSANIGVRLSYRRGPNIDRLDLTLKNKPGDAISEVHTHVSSGRDRSTQIIPFSDGATKTRRTFEFAWQNQSSTRLPEWSSDPAEYNIINKQPRFPGRFGLLGCILAIATWCWLISKTQRESKSWLDNLCISLPIVAICWLLIRILPDTTYSVDELELTAATSDHVSGIYEALQLNDEQLTVTALGTILEDDILEQTYLGTLESISSVSDEPLTTLRSVDVVDCDFSAPITNDALTTNCRWTVEATVEHWGHAHNRTLLFGGQIQFVRHGAHWKIRTFRPVSSKIVAPDEAAASKS